MDNNTRQALWQCWTQTGYIEDTYPQIAKEIRRDGGDVADFLEAHYPGLIRELANHAPGSPLSGTYGKKARGKKDNHGEKSLVDDVAALVKSKIPKSDIKDVIDSYWQAVMQRVAEGKNVQIYCVGSFRGIRRKIKGALRPTFKFTMSDSFKKIVFDMMDQLDLYSDAFPVHESRSRMSHK